LRPTSLEVVGEVLGGAFGEGGDEDALAALDALAAELDGFVDLAFERAMVMTGSSRPVGRMICSTMRACRGWDVEGFDRLFACRSRF
jgi:hypothetical protein